MFQPHLAEQAERCSCSLPMAPSFWKPHPKKLRTKNLPPPIHTVLIRNLRGVLKSRTSLFRSIRNGFCII
jgi:hypothetical protein